MTDHTLTIVEEHGGFVVYEDGERISDRYKDRAAAEERLARWRAGICDVCGSDCCGSQNVIWELYGEDERLVRAGHAMQEAIIDYIIQSQMRDRCDRDNFDNAKIEIDHSRARAIELLCQRRRSGPMTKASPARNSTMTRRDGGEAS